MTRLRLAVSYSLICAAGSGCGAAIHVAVDEPIRPVGPANATVLAVMPGTVDPGSEWIRPRSLPVLFEKLTGRYPDLRIVGPDEAANRLAVQSLAGEYADLLSDYDLAGVIDPERIDVLLNAVGATHLLYLRTGYGSEEVDRTTTNLGGTPLFYSATHQRLYAVARLWDPGGSRPCWEASFHLKSERGPFSSTRDKADLVEALAASIVEKMPLSGAQAVERR